MPGALDCFEQEMKNKILSSAVCRLLPLLRKAYPDAKCSLDFKTPLQLLVATILSAQCTDVRVNKVVGPLFQKYGNAEDFAQADRVELETMIQSTGFYHSKAKNIQESCKILCEKYGGGVPADLDSLLQLPGVGRKTANVVLGNAFGVIAGVVVDTHVSRLARRIGLSSEKTPEKIEKDLMQLFPKKSWVELSHLLIQLG
ncbi:MAG: endonuclease III, partial [Planctomycetaceae bacterium]|nr:endonuclease III [Planctomycetaceae bacterium]